MLIRKRKWLVIRKKSQCKWLNLDAGVPSAWTVRARPRPPLASRRWISPLCGSVLPSWRSCAALVAAAPSSLISCQLPWSLSPTSSSEKSPRIEGHGCAVTRVVSGLECTAQRFSWSPRNGLRPGPAKSCGSRRWERGSGPPKEKGSCGHKTWAGWPLAWWTEGATLRFAVSVRMKLWSCCHVHEHSEKNVLARKHLYFIHMKAELREFRLWKHNSCSKWRTYYDIAYL